MTYRVEVEYGDPAAPSVFEGLWADQAESGMDAFLKDMLGLDGSVISRITIIREA